jgi:hypothetical protein
MATLFSVHCLVTTFSGPLPWPETEEGCETTLHMNMYTTRGRKQRVNRTQTVSLCVKGTPKILKKADFGNSDRG